MLDKKKLALIIAGCVGVAGGIAAAVKIYISNKKDEEEISFDNEDVEETVKYPKLVSLEKPELDKMVNDSIIEAQGYLTFDQVKNADKPDKPEEHAHICTEHDYVETYLDYDHHTCTWYPNEKRLVDLDDDFAALVPVRAFVGKAIENALYDETKSEDYSKVLYAVNHDLRRVYEILVSSDSGYLEDLASWNEGEEDDD